MLRNAMRCVVLVVCLAVAGVAATADQPNLVFQKNKLVFNGKSVWPIFWSASSACPDSNTVSQLVEIGVIFVDDFGSDCGSGSEPGNDVAHLHLVLQGRLKWYAEPAWKQRELRGLPELISGPPQLDSSWIDNSDLSRCQHSTTTDEYNGVKLKAKFKPQIYLIYLSSKLGPHIPSCLTKVRFHAVFWTAVIAGASGTEYVTDFGGVPLNVDLVILEQAKVEASWLSVIQPVLLAANRNASVESARPVRAMAKRYGRYTYVFVVNTSNRIAQASFKLPGLRGKHKASVLRENRSLKVRKSLFRDKFKGLEVHIYRIK